MIVKASGNEAFIENSSSGQVSPILTIILPEEQN
jgi:hypothetical protein